MSSLNKFSAKTQRQLYKQTKIHIIINNSIVQYDVCQLTYHDAEKYKSTRSLSFIIVLVGSKFSNVERRVGPKTCSIAEIGSFFDFFVDILCETFHR